MYIFSFNREVFIFSDVEFVLVMVLVMVGSHDWPPFEASGPLFLPYLGHW